MAHGKSLENRYTNAPKKTYETITENERHGWFNRPITFRNPERVERKARQLAIRRAAKARARVNGKRT